MFGLFKKKKEEDKGFNSSYINIVVERQVNSTLIQEVAEFMAVEDRSDSKSLVARNDEYSFIEEMDFSKVTWINTLETTMRIKDMPVKEKLELLDKDIKAQTNRINRIKDGYYIPRKKKVDKDGKPVLKDKKPIFYDDEDNKVKVNLIDEEVKLRLLEVLREHTQDYDDKAIYEVINSNGYRELRFLAVDEFLYPLCRSPNKKTIYRNMVTKKKVYKVEADLNRDEFEKSITSKIQNFFKNAMPFMVIIVFIVLLFALVNVDKDRKELSQNIHDVEEKYADLLYASEQKHTEATAKCSYVLSKIVEGNEELLEHANTQMQLMTKEINSTVNNNAHFINNLREEVVNKAKTEVQG